MSGLRTNLSPVSELAIDLDRNGGDALHRQIETSIRQRIRSGALPADVALPPSLLFLIWISKPSLGEVTTELADYTVPSGQNCAGRSYTGLRILYKAGSTAGTDTFKYTIEFPHEPSNPTPSKGPQAITVSVVVR